jgi:hypothetical protein
MVVSSLRGRLAEHEAKSSHLHKMVVGGDEGGGGEPGGDPLAHDSKSGHPYPGKPSTILL